MATVLDGYTITGLQVAASCDNDALSLEIESKYDTGEKDNKGKPIYDTGAIEDADGSAPTMDVDGKVARITWSSTKPMNFEYTNIAFWVKVTATTNVTAGCYEIKLHCHPGNLYTFATGKSDGFSENHNEDEANLISGAAIVYDTLPMVALTKTTFDVPTMEKWLASGRNSGDYPIAPYLKIVAKEGDEVKVFDVSSDYLTTSLGGNKLGLTPSTTAATDKKFTVTRAEAAGASHSVTTETELTYSVRKEQSDLWKAGFGTNSGYYEEPSKILTANGNGSYLNTQGEVVAPEYGATVSWRPIGLYPNVFDQYGSSKTLSGYTVKATVTLYNVADTTLSTPLETSDDAYNCVNFTGNSGTSNINNLYVSNQLAKDVRCKVQLETYQGETLVDGKGETLSFVIRNTKPYAAGISIKLKNSADEELTDTNFTIPTGNETLQIKIVPTVNSQFGTPLDVQPEVTVTASNGTTSYDSTSTEGVKLENNVLTITSDAWKQMASTVNSMTITISAYPNDKTSLVATKTITLTRAASKAAYLASGESGTETNLVSGKIFLNHDNMNLPGINAKDKSLCAAYPVYVMDQYGNTMQSGGKDVTVPAANFKLYRAVVDNNDPAGILYSPGTDKYVKSTEIGTSNATFSANSNGVKLEITNAWDATKNQLAVPDGHYIIEATYPNPNNGNQPLVARCVIKLTKSDSVPTTATVTAGGSIEVPYADSTDTYNSTVLTATVTDQYGDEITSGITMELDPSVTNFSVYETNATTPIKTFAKENNAVQVTKNTSASTLTVKVSKDLAEYMVKQDGTVVTNGELRLPVKVTVGKGENAPTFNTTAKVKVSREASVLKKATVVMKQGETEVENLPIDVPTTPAPTISRTTPKTTTSYSFAVTGVDQYGDELKDLTVIGGGTTAGTTEISWVNDQKGGYLLNVTSTASGEFDLYIQSGATKQWFYVKFAPMQFFSDDKGTTEYQISDMLDLTTRTYGGELWANFVGTNGTLRKTTENGKKSIYVKEGNESYQELLDGKVKVVVKRGDTEIFDSSKTYTEGQNPKADAGDYTVYIVYVKGENDEYEVCHGSFKIEPKEVTIVLDPAVTDAKIEKVYDGDTTLPENDPKMVLKPEGVVGIDDDHLDSVSIDSSALKFAKKDADERIAIQLVEGKDCLKLNYNTNEETPATNYTVKLDTNGNVEGLTGTITKKALDSVTVTYADKPWDNTDDATGTPTITYEGAIDNNQITINVADVKYAHSDSTKLNSDVGATVTGGTVTLGNDAVSKNYTLPSTITWQGGIVKATFKIVLGDNKRFTYGNEGDNLKVKTEQLYVGTKKIEEVNSALVTYFATNKPELRVMESNGTTAAKRNSRDYYNWTGSSAYQLKEPDTGAGANYTFELDKSYTLTVDQLWITVSGTGLTKTYDGGNDLGDLTNASFTIECKTNGDKPSNENYSVLPNKLKYDSADAGENKTIKAKTTGIGNEKEFSLKVTDANGQEIKLSEAERLNYSVTVSLTGTINKYTLRVMPKSMSDLVYGSCDTAIGDALKADGTGNLTSDVLPLGYAAPRFNGTMVLKNADGTQATKTNGHYDVGTYTVTQGDVTETTGNYTINFETRDWTINKALANSALGDLNDLQATRNKTNEITLTPNYPITSTPTIRVVDGSEWIDGTPTVEVTSDGKIKITLPVEDGKVEDTSKVKLELTIPESGNYNQTVKEFDVKIIDKLVQDQFEIVQGASGTYSYSKGSLQLTTSGKAEGSTVTWSIADADKVYAEVNANGYVTFKKPTTTGIIITAAASETNDYAAASDTYTLTITKGQVTITASSATMTANDPLPGFSATASGLNPKDSVSDVFQTLTATVSTDGKTAGTFRVTPNAVFKTGVKDWNEYYELSFVQGTLTVNPAVSVIDTVLPTIIAGNGCANGYANCACESFYDLDASRWYHEAIDWAYSLGLMNGTTKSTFGPNAAATRAQTWTMLARIAGQDTRRSSTWYEVGQKWAMNLGITDGTNPMGSLTREQLAAMLYRYVGSPAVNGTLTFTDSANVSAWARNAMIWAVQNGILDGVGGNRLNPKGTTTRAQAAAIFMRFSKLINK